MTAPNDKPPAERATQAETPSEKHVRQRFMVHSGDPGVLSDFVEAAEQDAALELAEKIGPSGAPHTVIVHMSPQHAQHLRDRYRETRLKIEPDQPLSPLQGGAVTGHPTQGQ